MSDQEWEFEFPADGSPEDEIEPGSPVIENVVFVVLGALSMLAIIIHLGQLFGLLG